MSQLMLVNPRKRRASKKRKTSVARRAVSSVKRRASSTLAKVRRRYRRNPIPKAGIVNQFKDGAIGAAGALAVDVIMTKIPALSTIGGAQAAPLVRGLVGVGVGMAVARFGKKAALGKQLAGGAVTVALYTAGRQMLAPQLGLSGDDYGLLGIDDGLLGLQEMGELYEPSPAGEMDLNGLQDMEMGALYDFE